MEDTPKINGHNGKPSNGSSVLLGGEIQKIIIRPTECEMKAYLLALLRHVNNVEYYLEVFKIGKNDPDRPHDIGGLHNKYSREVASRLALAPRFNLNTDEYTKNIFPGIELHREGQQHHHMWNLPNPKATEDDLLLGAVDAICSLREPRNYQGGSHDFNGIAQYFNEKKPLHNQEDILKFMLTEMKKTQQPNLPLITSYLKFPNIGLSKNIYDRIRELTNETVLVLSENYGYTTLQEP